MYKTVLEAVQTFCLRHLKAVHRFLCEFLGLDDLSCHFLELEQECTCNLVTVLI